MPTSRKILGQMANGSWIRRMFEEGDRLQKVLGPDRVFDYTLGNPVIEPPPALAAAVRELAAAEAPGVHRYMANAGLLETRQAVAAHLTRLHGCPMTAQQVLMTVGAAGALNCVLKAILDPGDEVIVFAPYFPEYPFYVDNHGGKLVVAETTADFGLDLAALRPLLGPRTRAVIVNSPNNPTGRIYDRASLGGLGELLRQAEARHGRPIYLIADEPYRHIVYDDAEVPSLYDVHPASVVCTSHSKDLALPGERIGYAAVNPAYPQAAALFDCLAFANRVLGFVNAPAFQQRLIARLQDERVDVEAYRRRRDLLVAGLNDVGWPVVAPQGAFYLFPATPIADDVAFVEILKRHGVLVVPGTGFGRPGHVRISYCLPEATIARSIPAFAEALAELGR